MTLKSILVSALFLTDLTVPSETLKSLGFHSIGDCLRRSGWLLRIISMIRGSLQEYEKEA
jgi:hypothetical protein